MAVSNNERTLDQLSIIRDAIDNALSTLQTCMPGIVKEVDLQRMTVTVQPAIQVQARQADGSLKLLDYPLLRDVPLYFPGGGGCTLSFPVKAGDECLLLFASRCIDLWWASSGVQAPFEVRKHDLSDAFALVGVRSQPRAIAGVSADSVQLRSDDGTASITLNPATQEISLQASTIKVLGNLEVQGNVSTQGTLSNNEVAVGSTHVHPVGSPNTGVPVAGG